MRTRTCILLPMRAALIISALALSGCGSSEEEAVPPLPREPKLSMIPSDLTSAAGAIPLQITINDYGAAVGVERLEPIATAVRLISWPEGDPVPVTTALEGFEPRQENGFRVSGSGKVTVTPGAPLEDRWYFLHLVQAPAAVDLASPPHLRKLADGRVGVRFTVGSAPQMRWVRRCFGEKGAPGKVVVDFSETIVLDSAEALTVDASGTCAPPPSVNSGGTGSSFSFACDGLSSTTPIRVLVASTVTGVSGTPIRGAGRPVDLPPAAFEPGSDCPFATLTPE